MKKKSEGQKHLSSRVRKSYSKKIYSSEKGNKRDVSETKKKQKIYQEEEYISKINLKSVEILLRIISFAQGRQRKLKREFWKFIRKRAIEEQRELNKGKNSRTEIVQQRINQLNKRFEKKIKLKVLQNMKSGLKFRKKMEKMISIRKSYVMRTILHKICFEECFTIKNVLFQSFCEEKPTLQSENIPTKSNIEYQVEQEISKMQKILMNIKCSYNRRKEELHDKLNNLIILNLSQSQLNYSLNSIISKQNPSLNNTAQMIQQNILKYQKLQNKSDQARQECQYILQNGAIPLSEKEVLKQIIKMLVPHQIKSLL